MCRAGDSVEVGSVLPAPGRMVVARLDGARMPDVDHVFHEFSDALLFPGWFGWNWPALSDCLRDLDWWPAEQYLVVVEHAALLLAGSAPDRLRLFRVLHDVVRHWGSSPGREPVAFRIVLMCDEDAHVARLRREVAEAGRRH